MNPKSVLESWSADFRRSDFPQNLKLTRAVFLARLSSVLKLGAFGQTFVAG